MSVTAASFRAMLPAFASTIRYPDVMVLFWLDQAVLLHNADRWGANLNLGIALWTAHNLTLEARNARASANNKVPSGGTGVQSSKSVDKVSISYDNSTTQVEGAGQYNATNYGQRWYTLSRMAGAGPLQSGAPSAGEILSGRGAWPGYLYPPH
jgi:hypothetical protein